MKTIKAIHIHTDSKFIGDTHRFFSGEYFSNTSIFIERKRQVATAVLGTTCLLFNQTKEDLRKVLDLCKSADVVVLYALDFTKIKIVLALPTNIKIVWRFFGYELYERRPDIFKSQLTRDQEIEQYTLKSQLKNCLRPFYHYWSLGYWDPFLTALKRVDYMLILNDEEYTFLQQYWPDLPMKVKLAHKDFGLDLVEPDFSAKVAESKPLIVLGNSRSVFNNHLDMINIVDSSGYRCKYNFTLLFNYGPENNYVRQVRKYVHGKPYYTLVDDFMAAKEFSAFYKRSTALVLDAYRQIAGANIFTAMANGTKIYLNDRNIHKQWLINEGFKVFSMEDFKFDLFNNQLCPDVETGMHNFKNLQNFAKRHTINDFQEVMVRMLVGGRSRLCTERMKR